MSGNGVRIGLVTIQLSAVTDPTGPKIGAYRVLRGGGWVGNGRRVRSAYRRRHDPSFRSVGTTAFGLPEVQKASQQESEPTLPDRRSRSGVGLAG